MPGVRVRALRSERSSVPGLRVQPDPGRCSRLIRELRRLASSWEAAPHRLRFDPPTERDPAIAWLSIYDAGQPTVLLTVGVHLTADRIAGDVLPHQLMTLPSEATRFRTGVAGTPEELAHAADAGFRKLVALAFERHEYDTGNRAEHRVALTDTGQRIVPTPRLPAGKEESLTVVLEGTHPLFPWSPPPPC